MYNTMVLVVQDGGLGARLQRRVISPERSPGHLLSGNHTGNLCVGGRRALGIDLGS